MDVLSVFHDILITSLTSIQLLAMKTETALLSATYVDTLTGALLTRIYQTSTYVQEAPGINKGFDYTRTNNPTRKVLEKPYFGP